MLSHDNLANALPRHAELLRELWVTYPRRPSGEQPRYTPPKSANYGPFGIPNAHHETGQTETKTTLSRQSGECAPRHAELLRELFVGDIPAPTVRRTATGIRRPNLPITGRVTWRHR